MFSPSEIDKKKAYLTMILSWDEICASTEIMSNVANNSDGLLSYFRSFRHLVISLSNLSDNINFIEKTLNEAGFEGASIATLRKELEFIRHIRNKGVAHLDNQLIEKSVQWQPMLFNTGIKGEVVPTTIFANIATLELAINSYVNNCGEHKVFSTVIDFVYPPDFKEVTNCMVSISQHCIDYLARRLEFLEDSIKYYEDKDTLHVNSVAAKTDFDLKKAPEYSYNKSESLTSLKEAFDKCLATIESEDEKLKLKDFFEKHIIDIYSKE